MEKNNEFFFSKKQGCHNAAYKSQNKIDRHHNEWTTGSNI